MMHLSDEQIQRTLDGELAPHDVAPVREHTAECAACRALIDQVRADTQAIDALLAQLDHALPITQATTIIRNAQPRTWRWMSYAAALCLVTLGGVAWAAPGSPLPALAHRLVSLVRGAPHPVAIPHVVARPTTQTEAPLPALPVNLAGLAVTPGRRLVVVFASAEPGGQVHVTLTDDDEVVVRAPSGSAKFTSTDGRLMIAATAAGMATGTVYELAIPRRAPSVEVRVEGRRIFRKDANDVTTAVSPTNGRYVLPLQ